MENLREDAAAERATPSPQRPASEAPRHSRWRWARIGSFVRVIAALWVVFAVSLLAYPLALLFWQSFQLPDEQFGFGNYVEMLNQPAMLEAAFNSVWVAGGTTLGAVLIAVPMAYLVSRTDMPGRRFVRSAAILTLAAPTFIAALGWILLLGPRAGMINEFIQNRLGLENPPFNIFTPWGIIFVLILFSYPLILMPVAAALDNMDAGLEQAAANLGAGPLTVLRRITLPLVTPAVIAGGMLVFVISFIIFGPVAVLGGPVNFDTVPTLMLKLMRRPPPRIEMAAVMAVPVLVILGSLVYAQRRIIGKRSFAVMGGKPGFRQTVGLGKLRWVAFAGCMAVLFVSLVLPFGVHLVTSVRRTMGRPFGAENFVMLENYRRLFQQPDAITAFTNSLVLAILAVIASIVLALIASWLIERAKSRMSPIIAPTMLSPLAFSGALLGIALVIAFARPPFGLAGGLLILLFAYVLRSIPFSFQYVRAGMQQIGPEVEEAARSLGAGWPKTYRWITLPLLRNSIAFVAMLNFVLMFRELETSVFLYTGRNPVISVVLYNLSLESRFQLMGAFAVVVLIVNIGMVLLAQRVFRDESWR